MKSLHLNCLPFIYNIMQASKANKYVSKYSKTGLCIAVKVLRMFARGNTFKSYKCDRGPIFQVSNLNRNLTSFKHWEIHYQPDPTTWNGSLGKWEPEMWRTYQVCVFDRLEKQYQKADFSSNWQVWNYNTEISIGKSMCCCILVWGHY